MDALDSCTEHSRGVAALRGLRPPPCSTSGGAGNSASTDAGAGEAKYWEGYYSRSLARRGNLGREDCYCEPEELLQVLLEQQLVPLGHAEALVVGCGTSSLSAGLSGLQLGPVLEVTSVDCSPTVVDWMSRRHPELAWCVANAASLDPVWRDRFALVVDKGVAGAASASDLYASAERYSAQGLDVLCVAPRGATFLSEYRRVLRPGGWVVLVMPEESAWLRQQASIPDAWSDHRTVSVSSGVIYAFRAAPYACALGELD